MPKELKLITAIKKEDDSVIETLTLNEPTAGQLDFAEANSKTGNGRTISLIAQVSSQNEKYIRMMCARDYKEAAKYISSFLEDSLPIGVS